MRSITSTKGIFISGILGVIVATAMLSFTFNKVAEHKSAMIEEEIEESLKTYIVEYISNGIVYTIWHANSFEYVGNSMLGFIDVETGKYILISTSNAIVTVSKQ